MRELRDLQKEYWSTRAQFVSDPKKVSIADPFQKDLEIKFIDQANLELGSLLEIGCGNGIMTRYFEKHAREVVAIDVSEEMIARAESDGSFESRTKFNVGDATQLEFKDSTFDTVVIVRVLINMSERKLQQKAVNEAHRVLKTDGCLILIEGSLESFEHINLARQLIGKDPISHSAVNLYLDDEFFERIVNSRFSILSKIDSGFYDYLTRVLFNAKDDNEVIEITPNQLRNNLRNLLNYKTDGLELNRFSRLKGGIYKKISI